MIAPERSFGSDAAKGGSVDLSRLRTWLDGRVGGLDGALTVQRVAGGRSNPTYLLADGTRSWILRRPPHGLVLPTAHDMAREHRVLRALRDTAVPVPEVLGLCEDVDVLGAPFFVMERLDGLTLRTRADTEVLSVGQRAALADAVVDTLADLHHVDPESVGLGDLGRPDGYLERQLRRWEKQWDASSTRPRPEVRTVLDRLGRSVPGPGPARIIHGDYKLDNLMVDRHAPERIIGVLDWEMSTLGDPVTDLAWLCAFWDRKGEPANPLSAGATAPEGFPAREALVERYVARRDVDPPAIDWYVGLADLKLAVILEGIHARHREGHTSGEDFDGVGDMVAPLLQRALERTDKL